MNRSRSQCKQGLLLTCAFVFAYAKSKFSHDVAHLRILAWMISMDDFFASEESFCLFISCYHSAGKVFQVSEK